GWIRLIRSTANSVKSELEQELKLHELHSDLKKAEQLQMSNLSPELQQSIEQLKAAAQSVNRPYQADHEIRPPEAAPVAPAVPVAGEVPSVDPLQESDPVQLASEPASKGEVKP
ncbi:MAG: Sec-independent protein translocase protein TatB, partial [Aeromonas sp.]